MSKYIPLISQLLRFDTLNALSVLMGVVCRKYTHKNVEFISCMMYWKCVELSPTTKMLGGWLKIRWEVGF